MEEEQKYCEDHNVYHTNHCPICKVEQNNEKYQQETFNFLLIFIGILSVINLILFILLNI